MSFRSLLLSVLVLTIACSSFAPVARADDDDDDDYVYRYRTYNSSPYYRSYARPYGYVGPYGYRTYSQPAVTYRTYSTYDPYRSSGYGYYDADGYRYYRNDSGGVVGRVVLNAILNNIR